MSATRVETFPFRLSYRLRLGRHPLLWVSISPPEYGKLDQKVRGILRYIQSSQEEEKEELREGCVEFLRGALLACHLS